MWINSSVLYQLSSLFQIEVFFKKIIAGVSVGDPVLRTGKPLSVELGPGTCWTELSIFFFHLVFVVIRLIILLWLTLDHFNF